MKARSCSHWRAIWFLSSLCSKIASKNCSNFFAWLHFSFANLKIGISHLCNSQDLTFVALQWSMFIWRKHSSPGMIVCTFCNWKGKQNTLCCQCCPLLWLSILPAPQKQNLVLQIVLQNWLCVSSNMFINCIIERLKRGQTKQEEKDAPLPCFCHTCLLAKPKEVFTSVLFKQLGYPIWRNGSSFCGHCVAIGMECCQWLQQ